MAEQAAEIPQEQQQQPEYVGRATPEEFMAAVAAEKEKGGAPAIEPPKASPEKEKIEEPTTPPAEQPTPPVTPPPADNIPPISPQRTWQQDIKELTLAQIMAEKGVDPKLIGLVSTYETQGDVTKWLSAATTNYDSMDDAAILRHQVLAKYPAITDPQEQEELFQDELGQYKLEALDPEDKEEAKEVRLSKIKLKAAVHETRNKLKQEQSDRLIPSYKPDAGKEEAAAKAAQELKQKQEYVSTHPSVKTLVEKKAVTLGEGEHAFDFPIENAEQTVEWAKAIQSEPDGMVDANGKPDVEEQIRIHTIAKHYKAILKSVFENGKVVGAKSFANELTNPGDEKPHTTSDDESNPYKAMAKNGKFRS